MPRNLSPSVLAAIGAPQKSLALFLELAFANETIWLWSGIGPVTGAGPAWDPGATFPYGQTFLGMGWMGRIESVPQNSELTAENMTLMLSGIPSELLGDVVTSVRLNGVARLWLGFFSSGQLLADPLQLWEGALDVPTVSDGAETCTISITVENSLLSLNLSSNRRFTTLDQQLDFPGDTGFEYVSAMQDLYLAYPCPILATQNVTSLDQAPDGTNAVTISPAGPIVLALPPGGGGTLQIVGNAFFNSGQFYNQTKNVTALGLWSSSDTGVAIVSNGTGGSLHFGNFGVGGGVITPVGHGVCTITFNFAMASCSLTVSVP